MQKYVVNVVNVVNVVKRFCFRTIRGSNGNTIIECEKIVLVVSNTTSVINITTMQEYMQKNDNM